ncbi:MAG: MerR family DNA-binding transcriptional regulator [Planctomycetota bacterium]
MPKGQPAEAHRRRVSAGAPPRDTVREAVLPPRKLFKIGEVMLHSGISRQTLHNYTMLGLITEEARTPSGHRLYGEDVFAQLARIDQLKKHMSLKKVRSLLEHEAGAKPESAAGGAS